MADPAPPSVWRLIISSRKAMIALVFGIPILFAIVAIEIAIAVMMVRGSLAPEKAIALAFGGVLGGATTAFALAKPLIEAWSKEEVAKTNATAPAPATPAPVVVNATAGATSGAADASKVE